MALSPSINLCLKSDCKTLILRETTGSYSIANPGGYGAPNVVPGDNLTITLIVTDPAGNIYTINKGSLTGFPTSDFTYEFQIPLSLLNNRTSIEDGYWTFSWTATYAGNLSYTTVFATVFTCSIDCCLRNMLGDIRLDNCDDCKKDYTYDEYVKVLSKRDSLKYAGECGDVSYISDVVTELQRICNKSKCKTCN